MRRISTLCTSIFFTSTLLLISGLAYSQTPSTCVAVKTACLVPVTNNFNSSAEGFTGAGFPPGRKTTIAYIPAAGNFQVVQENNPSTVTTTDANTRYILTSDIYEGDAVATVGFDLAGTAVLKTVGIEVLSTEGVVLASCEFTNYGSRGTPVCFTITDLDMHSQLVAFRITLTTENKPNNGEGSLSFDNLRAAFTAGAVTPVTFVSFNSKKVTGGTQLLWRVADEHDVKHYEVERSTDARTFASIGTVEATGSDSYSFTDAASVSGVAYYRIKNLDIDGKFKYSTILRVDNNAASAAILRLYPVPAQNEVTLQHPAVSDGSGAFIELVSEDGRRISSLRPAAGAMQTTLDVSSLPKGLYLVRFSSGTGVVETTKLVRQ